MGTNEPMNALLRRANEADMPDTPPRKRSQEGSLKPKWMAWPMGGVPGLVRDDYQSALDDASTWLLQHPDGEIEIHQRIALLRNKPVVIIVET
jgi:hypothetical protein